MGVDDTTVRNISNDICTGCALCANLCPVDAIVMKQNDKGFAHPSVNDEACIQCGLCLKKCPVSGVCQAISTEAPIGVFAAYSLDEATRYESTSGGLFTELAKPFIKNGGIVIGAAYDEDYTIYHTYAKNEQQLAALRQSKYAQSDKRLIYRFALSEMDAGRQVMFCGAPCETAAMKAFAEGNSGRLTVVDFLCLGVNSPAVYRAYLDELESSEGSKVSKIWFKNKEHGWNSFGTRVEFDNRNIYFGDRQTDPFMRGYIVHPLFIRESCTQCRFKSIPHASDLTFGDFWGIEKIIPKIDSFHGVSMALINTKKGLDLFEAAKDRLYWQKVSFDESIVSDNKNALIQSVALDSESKRFYQELSKFGFTKAITRCASDSLPSRLKRKLRRLLA